MSTEEKYVAAAYLVVFLFVLAYVAIMAAKLSRLEREVGELAELARERKRAEPRDSRRSRSRLAELLFWPALLAYGEAAVAYAGNARRPGRAGLFATWGVRLGWLPADGAARRPGGTEPDGFPWDTWAGSLNLFVWLVVTAYLIWGCRSRYRLLGLAVMPPAVCLLLAAWLGGATKTHVDGAYSSAFLALHVGLVLAAFAGFTLSAGLAALYLWQERRLKRPAGGRAARPRALAGHAGRPGGTRGRVRGARADRRDRRGLRPAPLARRFRRRADGRDAPHLARLRRVPRPSLRGSAGAAAAPPTSSLAGFALVVVARLGLPLTHFS